MAEEPKTTITVEKKTGYVVFGCTGCTCCSHENFIRGMIDDADEAEQRAKEDHRHKAVASQYAAHGIYTIREVEYEALSDGRIIIGSRVFDDGSFYESGEVANDMRYIGRELAVIGEYNKHL